MFVQSGMNKNFFLSLIRYAIFSSSRFVFGWVIVKSKEKNEKKIRLLLSLLLPFLKPILVSRSLWQGSRQQQKLLQLSLFAIGCFEKGKEREKIKSAAAAAGQ